MDPKMDSGFLTPGESVEHDYDILRELLPCEVIGIMDQMLCFEVCFRHDGKQGSLLILIVGIVDDMAYGTFSFTNFVYFSIH